MLSWHEAGSGNALTKSGCSGEATGRAGIQGSAREQLQCLCVRTSSRSESTSPEILSNFVSLRWSPL